MSNKSLESVLEELVVDHNANHVVVIPETISKVGENYSFVCKVGYKDNVSLYGVTGVQTVEIPELGIKAQVDFQPIKKSIDDWIVTEEPTIFVAKNVDGFEPTFGLSEFYTALNEVNLELSRLIEIVKEKDDGDWIKYVGLDKVQSETGEPTLKFTIGWNLQGHAEIDGIDTSYRFNHVETISSGGNSYPVTFELGNVHEIDPRTDEKWLHTGDMYVELSGAPESGEWQRETIYLPRSVRLWLRSTQQPVSWKSQQPRYARSLTK
jgi:hypothetical protein